MAVFKLELEMDYPPETLQSPPPPQTPLLRFFLGGGGGVQVYKGYICVGVKPETEGIESNSKTLNEVNHHASYKCRVT